MTSHPQEFRDCVRSKLCQILDDAAARPPLTTPLQLREVGPNAEAALLVRWRCHPRLPDPDDCERALLELLLERGRTTYRDIVRRLEEIHSESTIKRRLRHLTQLGLIVRMTDPPRGYELHPTLHR